MSCIVFFFYKGRHKKKKQTKENQFFQSFMSETGGHRKNIACSMFTILLGNSSLTNQNSLRLKLNFRRQNGLDTKISRTFFGLLTFGASTFRHCRPWSLKMSLASRRKGQCVLAGMITGCLRKIPSSMPGNSVF